MIMELLNRQNKFMKYVMVTIGTMLMAIAVNIIFEPMGIVTGGVSGIAIIIKSWTEGIIDGGIPLWFTNLVINIPLFITAIIVLGKKSILNTIYATATFIIGLYIVPMYEVVYKDYLLASVFGGVLMGVGLGLVFAYGCTTGGTDLLGAIFQAKIKHYSVAQLLLVIDSTIVIIGAAVFGVNKALYAVITVYITTKIMDGLLEGINFAKLAYVISDEHDKIANEILHNVNRGVTGIPVQGMYSNNDKNMLLCVVSKKEIVKLVDIVAQIDPKAFVIVSDVREVLGEGFIEFRQE